LVLVLAGDWGIGEKVGLILPADVFLQLFDF